MRRRITLALAGLLVVIGGFALFSGRVAAQHPQVLIDRAGGAENRIVVTLETDSAPTPGGSATLVLTATPLLDAPDLEVNWFVPTGATLSGDTSESFGPVAAGTSVTSRRQVTFPDAGEFEISATAGYSPQPAAKFGASGVLFFTVSPRASRVSDLNPTVHDPRDSRMAIQVTADPTPITRNADGDPCFFIVGHVERTDRPPMPGGYGANQTVRVTNALVEFREEDLIFDDSYGEVVSGNTGEFQASFCDDDGIFDDELELYVLVTAEIYVGQHLVAEVEDSAWIEENYEFESGRVVSEGGSHQIIVTLDMQQSGIFNMADAALDAWLVWRDNGGASGGDAIFEEEAEIQWEAGKGKENSHYTDFFGQISIADGPSDPDEWDDSVIIHEWGHMADDHYSCNDNPGGDHNFGDLIDPELAWGEGYPDFWQSAVRAARGRPNANFYLDWNTNFQGMVDLETYTRPGGGRVGDELSVAAAMWDLIDPVVVGGDDQVAHPLNMLQQTYTGSNFYDVAYYLFDDDCDVISFLKGWLLDGRPQDGNTAAALGLNMNVSLGFLQIVLDEMGTLRTVSADTPGQEAATNAVPPGRTRWWDEITMVVDRSASMAGPANVPKINSVKTILGEQVNDGTAKPNGTAFNLYTFDAGSPFIAPAAENRFYANTIMPAVNGLTATGVDAGCPVPGLGALSQAIQTKYDGEAWLYTDGDSADSLTSEQMRQALTARRLHASIVLLGGCGSPARKLPDVTGAERTYLGLAADGSQPTGIVPYLLTALGSGGQFIYVAPDQLANAVDIVRAQLSHTAGAGRWSDYVSNNFTYRWDRLEPWEYDWFPGFALGQDAGQIGSNGLRIALDPPISFYGEAQALVEVSENGAILMNPCTLDPQFCSFLFSQYIEILSTDLKWATEIKPPARQPTDCGITFQYGTQVRAYTGKVDDQWHIISTEGLAQYGDPGSGDTGCRAYQVWLNYKTGEIRFQYYQLRQEAGAAEIGLIESLFFAPNQLIISKNDLAGAYSGMGYKFTPAPPQPSKTYEVEVDPFIESVVFLQTGYSGDFAPMAITYPGGAVVDCNNTAQVKCVTVDNIPGDRMMQFVQVDTDGQVGVFTAVVGVGPSGNSTFSFNALAASELNISSPDLRSLRTGQYAHNFLVDLGRAAEGNKLKGWLQTPSGLPYGDPFDLFDDGEHGDGEKSDGRFGSDSFATPFPGAAYLWVEGVIDGNHFKRSDPAPFNFQPAYITQPVEAKSGYYDSAPVEMVFYAWNSDTVDHCFTVGFTWPSNWSFYSPQSHGICIAANQGTPVYAYVEAIAGSGPDDSGEISLTLTEVDDGAITTSATGKVTFYLHPLGLEFDNPWVDVPIPPDGETTVELALVLRDFKGQLVDITKPFEGSISADGGTVELPTGYYENGRLPVLFTAGNSEGEATIYVIAEGGLEATTSIMLAEPVAATIEITAETIDLSETDGTDLQITVLNTSGEPAIGETVRIGVSDDSGDKGTIDGDEFIEAATNKSGIVNSRFDKTAGATGTVVVRAQLLDEEGDVVKETSVLLYLSEPPASLMIYLPVVGRN